LSDETNMHLHRVLSALLLIPAFLLIVHAGSPLIFHLLVGLVVILAAWEFAQLCPAGADTRLGLLTAAGAIAWQGSLALGVGAEAVPLGVAALALLRLVSSRAGFREAAIRGAWLLLGAAYAGGFLGTAALLRNLPAGRELIYLLVLTTWAGDSGAYYAGRSFGRRPLAPAISPKKTLEGAAGGLLAAALVALIAGRWFLPGFSGAEAAVLGLLLAVVGTLGDLVESALKRAVGVKDSGALIPGHGGVLDRLDSLMFAGPFLYALVRLGVL